ncbi:MAG TPA: iron-containing alcohol dehydrogenase, partial [Candidatus Jeotgalibaca merdavium]|nr:iron-containing alcohol dehydrogenase [Candidatus Jeotgalibaca merdavium]
MVNRMILNETAYFGSGAIQHIPEEVTRRGFKKALIVTDKGLVEAGLLEKVTQLLDQHQL